MYNVNKFRYGYLKVKDLIAELAKEDPEAMLSIGGGNETYIHVDNENNIVMLDYEACDMDVDINMDKHKIITHEEAIDMLKTITEHLIMDGGSKEIYNSYKDLGFDKENILALYNFNMEDIYGD